MAQVPQRPAGWRAGRLPSVRGFRYAVHKGPSLGSAWVVDLMLFPVRFEAMAGSVAPAARRLGMAASRRTGSSVPMWLTAWTLALAMAGCLETEFGPAVTDTTSQIGPVDSGADAASDSASGETSGLDSTLDSQETLDSSEVSCPGSPGCACTTPEECGAGACLVTANGKRCSAFCVEGKCDVGAVCGAVAVDIPGAATATKFGVCLPRWPTDCVPCLASTECANPADPKANCVDPAGGDGGTGWFCAASCKQDADCAPGRTCKASKGSDGSVHQACVPNSGQCGCSPLAVQTAATTSCRKTSPGMGVCKGMRSCTGGTLSDCSAPTPVAEACNGLDDDCDNAVDEPADATPLCTDQEPCTADSCKGSEGCAFLPSDVSCTDDNSCTSADKCVAGKCAGGPTNCDDNNPCTTDSCDANAGCSYAAVSGPCDDGDKCTQGDSCTVGECVSGKVLSCVDGNPCTNDWCDAAQGCTSLPNDVTCTDGNECTGVDFCKAGKCAGPLLACDDGWGCTTDSCDPLSGCSFASGAPSCGQATVPYAIAMDCTETGFVGWRVSAPGIAVANPQPPPVAWKLDNLPALGGLSQCALNINNGKDLACGFLQNSVDAWAESPWIDLTAVQADAPVVLRLESAGFWSSAWAAKILVRQENQPWKELPKLAASGAVWGKVSVDLPELAGKVGQIRFQFTASDCSENNGTGWFVRKLSLAVEPCAKSNGGCATTAVCTTSPNNTALCTCSPGYTGNGKTCSDINECATGNGGCAVGATCTNSIGSFSCGCKPGFQGDGVTCTDINECTTGKAGCAADATCTNTQGSFVCACKPGYTGNGKTCTDINECATANGGCAVQATCTNLPGTLQCACKAGYSGNGKTCSDVDECAVGLADCATAATCSNTVGSFGCTCNKGYLGNGKSCLLYGSAELPASTCKAIQLANPAAMSGPYWLNLAGSTVQVSCDMVTDGGGWTLVGYKTDLVLKPNNTKCCGASWLPTDFSTYLTLAQIKALQALSTEGRQTYVGQCVKFAHYEYNSANYTRAIGFRFADGTQSLSGSKSYLPLDITVVSDGCKPLLSIPATTQFAILSTKVPVINIETDYQGSNGQFGSQLTKQPAMLR